MPKQVDQWFSRYGNPMKPVVPGVRAVDSICLHCGQAAGSVFVHGHVQCLACGCVQVPCCEGAALDVDGSSEAASHSFGGKR